MRRKVVRLGLLDCRVRIALEGPALQPGLGRTLGLGGRGKGSARDIPRRAAERRPWRSPVDGYKTLRQAQREQNSRSNLHNRLMKPAFLFRPAVAAAQRNKLASIQDVRIQAATRLHNQP